MRARLLYFAVLLAVLSLPGCPGSEEGGADVGVGAPTDTGANPPADAGDTPGDTGPGIVSPILGTWKAEAGPVGGADGTAFYPSGKYAMFSSVATCASMMVDSYTVEGNVLTQQIGTERPPLVLTFAVTDDRLVLTHPQEGDMAFVRAPNPCDEPSGTGGGPNQPPDTQLGNVHGSWEVQGDAPGVHTLHYGGVYTRSSSPTNCSDTPLGTWELTGTTLRWSLGASEGAFELRRLENGNLEATKPDQSTQEWMALQAGCHNQPTSFPIIGTWVPSGDALSPMAFSDQLARSLTSVDTCESNATYRYVLGGVPPFVLLHAIDADNAQAPLMVGRFERIDDDQFKLTVRGAETVFTRARANCERPTVNVPLAGTWSSISNGAPQLAFGDGTGGFIIEDLEECRRGANFAFTLDGAPPELMIITERAGDRVMDRYTFEVLNDDSFRITKDNVGWTYTRAQRNCLAGGGGPPQLDYPIAGTWNASGGGPGRLLEVEDQGSYGRFLTNVPTCTGETFFGFVLQADPPMFMQFEENRPQKDFVFRRISNDSFGLAHGGQETIYTRAENRCTADPGGGGELDYDVIGTWTTNAQGQPSLGFTRDEHGVFGFEMSAINPCTRTVFFGVRLLAEPPMLERVYEGQGPNNPDVRRHPLRIIDASHFAITVDGSEVTYSKVRSDCHNMNDNGPPPPPPELDRQQLIGTWGAAQGRGGYAFSANNTFKELSNINGCATNRTGPFELVGNLLTLRFGVNERPGFYTGEIVNNNTLRLTDDNQQTREFTRSRATCHQ